MTETLLSKFSDLLKNHDLDMKTADLEYFYNNDLEGFFNENGGYTTFKKLMTNLGAKPAPDISTQWAEHAATMMHTGQNERFNKHWLLRLANKTRIAEHNAQTNKTFSVLDVEGALDYKTPNQEGPPKQGNAYYSYLQ